jgi:hypothetical protein
MGYSARAEEEGRGELDACLCSAVGNEQGDGGGLGLTGSGFHDLRRRAGYGGDSGPLNSDWAGFGSSAC